MKKYFIGAVISSLICSTIGFGYVQKLQNDHDLVLKALKTEHRTERSSYIQNSEIFLKGLSDKDPRPRNPLGRTDIASPVATLYTTQPIFDLTKEKIDHLCMNNAYTDQFGVHHWQILMRLKDPNIFQKIHAEVGTFSNPENIPIGLFIFGTHREGVKIGQFTQHAEEDIVSVRGDSDILFEITDNDTMGEFAIDLHALSPTQKVVPCHDKLYEPKLYENIDNWSRAPFTSTRE